MYDIEINQMSAFYGNVCALENIDLSIKSKEFLGIVGPNGGGKTTLLKVIMGFIKPLKGTAIINDKKIIGYVPQHTTFQRSFPINVMDVVMMGRPNKGAWFQRPSYSETEYAKKILEKLGLINLKYRQIGELSGGQVQKVLIARALMMDSDILILDEPNAHLDTETRKDIVEILKELKEHKTILMVTHSIEDILECIDSLAIVNQRVERYTKEELMDKKIIQSSNIYTGNPFIDFQSHGRQ